MHLQESPQKVLHLCSRQHKDSLQLAEIQQLCLGKAEKGNNPDRQWTWRDPRYKYAPTRARNQPGYVGSYAMDGLGMALHCVYSTFTFEEAVLKCVNMAGTCRMFVCAILCCLFTLLIVLRCVVRCVCTGHLFVDRRCRYGGCNNRTNCR